MTAAQKQVELAGCFVDKVGTTLRLQFSTAPTILYILYISYIYGGKTVRPDDLPISRHPVRTEQRAATDMAYAASGTISGRIPESTRKRTRFHLLLPEPRQGH